MEKWIITKAFYLCAFLKSFVKAPQYWIWAVFNKSKVVEVKKLHKRVINELDRWGVKLPTEFKINILGTSCKHEPNTDRIFFDLASFNKRFLHSYENPLGVIRHEYGHACSHHYIDQLGLEGLKNFKKVFGNYYTPYEPYIFLMWRKKRFDWKNYISKYAQIHPDESFAECFVYFMRKKGNVSHLKRHRPAVYEKMLFVKEVLKELGAIDFTDD